MAAWMELTQTDFRKFPVQMIDVGARHVRFYVPEPVKPGLQSLLEGDDKLRKREQLRLVTDLFNGSDRIYASAPFGRFTPSPQLEKRINELREHGYPAQPLNQLFLVVYDVGPWPDFTEKFPDGVYLQGRAYRDDIYQALAMAPDEYVLGFQRYGTKRPVRGVVLTNQRLALLDNGEAVSYPWRDVRRFERAGVFQKVRVNDDIRLKMLPAMQRVTEAMTAYQTVDFAMAIREQGWVAEMGLMVLNLA